MPAGKLPSKIYKTILDSLHDGICFENLEKRITYWNRGAERITGYKSHDVVGRSCDNCIIWQGDKKECPMAKTLEDGVAREFDFELKAKNGKTAYLTAKVYPIISEKGDIIGAVEVFTDNSSVFETVKELEKLILLDPLTGIGNRRLLELQLKAFLDRFNRYGMPFGVLFIDIDDFKKVNDTYGHSTGDKVLKMVARTMLNSSRSFDVIGRWGGEEFVAIIENVDGERLYKVAERHRKLVESSYVEENGAKIKVTISVGATVAKKGDTMESLIVRADRLMYESKKAGKNRVTLG